MENIRHTESDVELRILTGISRLLPRMPKVGAIGNFLKRIYLRKKRNPVETEIFGYKMVLDPGEYVDAEILFIPQLYDYREISFLEKNLEKGDCFVDVGTHLGLYSLAASLCVGDEGFVLALEANPTTCQKLGFTLKRNNIKNITAVNIGVADKACTMRLGLNTSGNSGGDSFVISHDEGVDVECLPLLDILSMHNISKVRGMKFDIEGFEFRVLRRFFDDAPLSLYPDFIILEFNPEFIAVAGGDSLDLVKSKGYSEVLRSRLNFVLQKSVAFDK
ncbi:MAG: FkbM family methyltransferase [Nitrospirae bacterium]|nr:MAG: FkbM family methyltransferase [Nitrospirota bacterium]